MTISDVARLAGLSRSTVSRVINNHPNVSEKKKELVKKSMVQLGYIPNSNAQSLRKQKTNIIAILVPKLTNPFFAYLVESAELEAEKNGFQILICNTMYDKQREMNFLHLLKNKQVDGIILCSIENEWKEIDTMKQTGPIVLCNEYIAEANVPSVRMDQQEGGYVGTRHLIRKGHKKIGYCWGGILSGISRDRLEGYQKAMNEKGFAINKNWFFSDVFDIKDGRKVMNDIAKMKDKPTALFTGSDEVAAGIISEARKIGFHVPGDIAVIGFDDQPITTIMEPMVTTIRQPIEKIGKKAIEVMIHLLTSKGNKSEKMIHELPFKLIIRESS